MNMFGSHIVQLETVDSTSNYVAKALEQGEYDEGTVILAHNQTEGRGQRGSIWQSAAGANLTFSFALKVNFLPTHLQFLVAKAISLGLTDYLGSIFGPTVWIKWPNDVLLERAKIAGILIEMKSGTVRHAIVGVGLNVNQKSFPTGFKATSMAIELGMDLSLLEVMRGLTDFMGARIAQLTAGDYDQLSAAYKEQLFGRDSWVNFSTNSRNFQGMIVGVDNSGVLLVRSRQGAAYSFRAKEVKIAY